MPLEQAGRLQLRCVDQQRITPRRKTAIRDLLVAIDRQQPLARPGAGLLFANRGYCLAGAAEMARVL